MNNTLTQFEILTLQQEERNFVLAVVVAIITFLSVFLFYLDYRSKKSKEMAEKSILVAEKFANEIISRISIISLVFKSAGLTDIAKRVKFTKFYDFDSTELNELYDQKAIDKYLNTLNSLSFNVGDKEQGALAYVSETLNCLEYLCMYVATDVADEKYIYDSLHDVFFTIVHLLYIIIAFRNKDYKNVYYSNLSYVFNTWKDKYLKACKKEQKYSKRIKNRINKTK